MFSFFQGLCCLVNLLNIKTSNCFYTKETDVISCKGGTKDMIEQHVLLLYSEMLHNKIPLVFIPSFQHALYLLTFFKKVLLTI